MSKRAFESSVCPRSKKADISVETAHETSAAYSEQASQYKQNISSTSDERFVPVASREDRSDMSREMLEMLMTGQKRNHWRGVPFGKCAFDLIAYQQLLFEQRPCTIIELGSWCGGSALWFADQGPICGSEEQRVVAVDITLENMAPAVLSHPAIEVHACDMSKIDSLFTPSFAASLPRPWLVVEDAHFEFEAVMRTFHSLLQPGDYFIVEDTSELLLDWYDGEDEGAWKSTDDACRRKRKLMREYGTRFPELYRCDTKYLDMWGYNAMKCWNTIFKRIA